MFFIYLDFDQSKQKFSNGNVISQQNFKNSTKCMMRFYYISGTYIDQFIPLPQNQGFIITHE